MLFEHALPLHGELWLSYNDYPKKVKDISGDDTLPQVSSMLSSQEDEISPWSNLPIDIARIIFEEAMETRPKPVQLARVCREVNRWLEPFIYRHLAFHTSSSFRKFQDTFSKRHWSMTKPHVFYQRNVKTFAAFSGICMPYEAAYTIIRNLTGLTSLSWSAAGVIAWHALLDTSDLGLLPQWKDVTVTNVYNDSSSSEEEDIYPFQNLRRLHVQSYYLHHTGKAGFLFRVFRHLTHIDLDYFHPHLPWHSLLHLNDLTHLCIDDINLPNIRRNPGILEERVLSLLSVCPPNVKVILIGCVKPRDTDDFDIMDSEFNTFIPPKLPVKSTTFHEAFAHYHMQTRPIDLNIVVRMTIGNFDPRIVVASLAVLPQSHVFKDLVVCIRDMCDWDQAGERSKDRWMLAEEIIRRRG